MGNLYSTLKTLAFIVLIINSNNVFSQNSVPACAPFEGYTESFHTNGSGKTSVIKPILRLLMNTSGFNDETVFYFEQGGTTAFQPAFDAYKLIFNPGIAPYIGSMSDSILTSISGLPKLPVNLNIQVKAITPATGSFTFSSQLTDFPDNVCVTLYDTQTGISTNILTSDYVCTLYNTTSNARFTINFFTTDLEASSSVKQADCSSPKGGFITAIGSNKGPWNYEWRNGDSIIKTSFNKTTADSLTLLSGGKYTVKINSIGQCDNFSKSFLMDLVVATKAVFVSDVLTTSLSNSGTVKFINNSTNAQFSMWDFGDKTGTWFVPCPAHNYKTAGVYTINLITESISHCKDTAQQTITVIDDVTGIKTFDMRINVDLSFMTQGYYSLNLTSGSPIDVNIDLLDIKGTVLKSTKLKQIISTNQAVELDGLAQGIYLLNVSEDGEKGRTFKLIK